MGYAVDTSEASVDKGCRKRWLSQKETSDGTEFTVKQRKHQPLRYFLSLITAITVFFVTVNWMKSSGIKPDGFTGFLLILGFIAVFIMSLAALLLFFITLRHSIFARAQSRFIINAEGIVLLSHGGRLRKKLLPWEHVSEFRVQGGGTAPYASGGDTVYAYNGGIGAVGAGIAGGTQAVAEGAFGVVRAMFSTMRAFVAIRYKNQEIRLAEILNHPEALALFQAIGEARRPGRRE